ncbi:MAG: hypothetical protein JKY34_06110, partial [Kordiimonadaceae bacterium]|nr:hypothetical protein [Kordiimonadaceae bacterium]
MGLFGFIGKVLGIGGARSSKIEISKVSASAGLPIIYGKRRIEPITVFKVVSRDSMIVSNISAYDSVHQSYSSSDAEQSKNNDFLHRIDVWGQGIIEGIELFWLDGDAHTSGRFKSNQYFRGLSKFGSEIQGVATELAAGHSDWTIEHQGKGVAYTWTRFYNVGKKEQFDGEPEVEALVKGLKLYDPR